MSATPNPRLIFHIGDFHDWVEAKANGEYRMSTRGHKLADVGFIHASTAEQVESVANAVFRGARGLILLVIDPARVTSEIRYEPAMVENPQARRVVSEAKTERQETVTAYFPHIYGPLNVNAVIEALAFDAESNGRFYFPKELVEKL